MAIAVAALVAPAAAEAATQVSYPSFSDVSALQLNGNAYQNGATVQLTDASANEAGSVYTSSPIDVSGSWSVAYHMQFTDPGAADGAAFVIQPGASTALAPSTGPYGGSGHGYQSAAPYLGLDIDAYRDTAGIVVGPEAPYEGVRSYLPLHSQTADWYVWADYDATAETLSMYVSTSSAKPSTPLVTRAGIDLATVFGTTQAYAGFAGATGAQTMGIDVASWFFGPSPQPPASEAPISVSGQSITATEGAQFTGTVATVSGDPDSPPADYSVQIDWGDQTTSAGTVDANGNVSGTHTYTEQGNYTVTTTVTDTDDTSNTASAKSAAEVADAALSASGTSNSSQPVFSGTVATFTDGNPSASPADFSATIDWGDHTTSTGTVSANASGGFDVTGSHAYGQADSYIVTVSIDDDGGSSTSATSTVLIYELAGTGGSFVIGDGNAAIGSKVDFWGSHWDAENSLSSGSAPSSFKGYAAYASPNPPVCGSGATFTATTGDSGQPPATLPQYMGVYVTSAVTKDGREITGDIDHIVVVKTDSGYQPDPGHDGTGQVVASVC